MIPIGTVGISPHQSGAFAFTSTSVVLTIRSGSPMVHRVVSFQTTGGGMSAGLPRGAPLSAQRAIIAISSSLSDGSF